MSVLSQPHEMDLLDDPALPVFLFWHTAHAHCSSTMRLPWEAPLPPPIPPPRPIELLSLIFLTSVGGAAVVAFILRKTSAPLGSAALNTSSAMHGTASAWWFMQLSVAVVVVTPAVMFPCFISALLPGPIVILIVLPAALLIRASDAGSGAEHAGEPEDTTDAEHAGVGCQMRPAPTLHRGMSFHTTIKVVAVSKLRLALQKHPASEVLLQLHACLHRQWPHRVCVGWCCEVCARLLSTAAFRSR